MQPGQVQTSVDSAQDDAIGPQREPSLFGGQGEMRPALRRRGSCFLVFCAFALVFEAQQLLEDEPERLDREVVPVKGRVHSAETIN